MAGCGCKCKGSTRVHSACFKEWATTAEDPFRCSVCKGALNAKFLEPFLGVEGLMMARVHNDEDEHSWSDTDSTDSADDVPDEGCWPHEHGVPTFDDGVFQYFLTLEHELIFGQSIRRAELAGKSRMVEKQVRMKQSLAQSQRQQLKARPSVQVKQRVAVYQRGRK